jgi:hypothetical protein
LEIHGEFKGLEFKEKLEQWWIQDQEITNKNRMADASDCGQHSTKKIQTQSTATSTKFERREQQT